MPLTGIYEPSAVLQLADGLFLIAEDEPAHPLSLVRIGASGRVRSSALRAGLLQYFSPFWPLNDLEGLALGQSGFVYGITSHSRNDEGRVVKAREKLVRFRVDGDKLVDRNVTTGLKRSLTAKFAVLAAAAKIRDVKNAGGLNVEGLEISPDQRRLLIGFRSPLQDGCAIVASIDNLAGIFDGDEAPRVCDDLDLLDLDGHGIRSLSYLPSLGGYLVIAGSDSRKQAPFRLWFWSGGTGAKARPVTVSGVANILHAEGVSPATIDGAERILIVSDDGDRDKRRSAHFLLLDPAHIRIAS